MQSETIAEFDPVLGPNWNEGSTIAAAFMEKFEADHFAGMVEKFADKFRDNLWTDIECFLLSDTRSNLSREIGRRVDECVAAILMGDRRLIDFYALERHQGEAVRAAVVAAIPRELQDSRIADLEAEVKRLHEMLENIRRA